MGKKFWGVQGDIASVGEFIRLYLGRYNRWSSPLYLIGESYGTFRAAGLSGWLVDRGMACNGIVLVSSILQYQTARFSKGNDLPYPLFLPTYTAIAWYHKKLPASLQQAGLKEATAEAEQVGLPIEVDAHHVTFMDSSGVAFLARLSIRSKHRVRLLRVPPTVRFLLEVTRIGELLDVVEGDESQFQPVGDSTS